MKRKRALEVLEVSPSTLQRYVKRGWIRADRKPNGYLDYNEEDVFRVAGKKIKGHALTVAYLRVNKETVAGKEKMIQQNREVHDWAIKRGIKIDRIYQDYGVAENAYREDFNRLLEDSMDGQISTVIVLTKCRLSRFSYYMVRKVLRHHGVRIEVVAPNLEDPYYLDEQTEDLAKVMSQARLDRIKKASD